MSKNSFEQPYIGELKDLFSAENQLTKASPKMAEASSSDELRRGFEDHLEQTKGHVDRLQRIFENARRKSYRKKMFGHGGTSER